jgi:hypothetical protein
MMLIGLVSSEATICIALIGTQRGLLAGGLWVGAIGLLWLLLILFIRPFPFGFGFMGVEVAIALATFFAVMVAPLWVARLFGWKFRFREKDSPAAVPAFPGGPLPSGPQPDESQPSESQFRVWHLLVLTAVVAAILGLGRLVAPWLAPFGDEWRWLWMLAMIGIQALPVTIICDSLAASVLLRDESAAKTWGLLAVVVLLPAVVALEYAAIFLLSGRLSDPTLIAVNLSFALSTGLSLLLLRAGGVVFDRDAR